MITCPSGIIEHLTNDCSVNLTCSPFPHDPGAQLFNFFRTLEKLCQDTAPNSDWFDHWHDFSPQKLKAAFTSNFKMPSNAKFMPSLRVWLRNEPLVNFFSSNNQPIEGVPDLKNQYLSTILEVKGIRVTKQTFGLQILLLQAKIEPKSAGFTPMRSLK